MFVAVAVIGCEYIPVKITTSLLEKKQTNKGLALNISTLSRFQYMCNLVNQWHNSFYLFQNIGVFIFAQTQKWKSNNHCTSNVQKFHFSIMFFQYLFYTPLSIRLNVSLYVQPAAAAEDTPLQNILQGIYCVFSPSSNTLLFGKGSRQQCDSSVMLLSQLWSMKEDKQCWEWDRLKPTFCISLRNIRLSLIGLSAVTGDQPSLWTLDSLLARNIIKVVKNILGHQVSLSV